MRACSTLGVLDNLLARDVVRVLRDDQRDDQSDDQSDGGRRVSKLVVVV